MQTDKSYQDITKTISFYSDTGGKCKECQSPLSGKNISEAINHYLAHGYKLLHIGQESELNDNFQLIARTVTVFAK